MKRVGNAYVALLAIALTGLLRLFLARYASSPRTTRRDFLRWVTTGATTFALTEAAASFVAFYWPTRIGKFGSKLQLKKADIPPVGAPPVANREGKFWLINNPDGVLAFYWKCTHLGCTVPWIASERQFHCPCHGSIFTREGVRIAGPAPRPLDLMAVWIEGDRVVVDTGAITQRKRYEAGQAVKLPA